MSEEELNDLKYIDCADYEIKRVDKAVETIRNLQKEKQELIDYLKDKIKEIKTNFSQVNGNYFMMNDKLEVYQEILDRIERNK